MIKELSLLPKKNHPRIKSSTITSHSFQNVIEDVELIKSNDHLNYFKDTYLPVEKVYKYFKNKQADTKLLNTIYKEVSKSAIYEFGNNSSLRF